MAVEKVAIRFDEDELTIGDLEDFETAAGCPLFEALKPVPVRDESGEKIFDEKGRPEVAVNLTAVQLKALVWIVKRQENPDYSIEDARNVKVTSLEIVGKDDDEGNDEAATALDPTEVAA